MYTLVVDNRSCPQCDNLLVKFSHAKIKSQWILNFSSNYSRWIFKHYYRPYYPANAINLHRCPWNWLYFNVLSLLVKNIRFELKCESTDWLNRRHLSKSIFFFGKTLYIDIWLVWWFHLNSCLQEVHSHGYINMIQ